MYVSSQRAFIERLKREHPKEWAQADGQKTTTDRMAHTQTTPDGRQITYLPNGQKLEKRAETVRAEDYSGLKKWEDKAKAGGVINLPLTISFDFVNGIYVCIRAFIDLPAKSIAGRGLNRTEKLNAGLSGFTSLGTWSIPMKIPVIKGIKKENSFHEFSKILKGKYMNQGYSRSQQMKIKWQDYKTNGLHLEINSINPPNDIQRIIKITYESINELEKQ